MVYNLGTQADLTAQAQAFSNALNLHCRCGGGLFFAGAAGGAPARQTQKIDGVAYAAVEVLCRWHSEPGATRPLGKLVAAIKRHDEGIVGWYKI